MDTATQTGADFGLDEATNALLGLIKEDAETPSHDDDEEKKLTEETTEEPEANEDEGDEGESEEPSEDEESEDDEDTDENEDEPSQKSDKNKVVLDHDANAFVKAKIDGKEVELKVSDLTRLYGQEAALTRKSTEVAEMRKTVETQTMKYAAGLEEMVKRAEERFKPYKDINWLALTKDPNVNPEQLQVLWSEAQKAQEDLQYLHTSLDGVVKEVEQQRHNHLVKQGAEAWKVLSDPDTGIKGWGDKMYADITKFAIDNGLNKDVVRNLVDPAAIKLLHKAMLFDKGKEAVSKTSKVNKTPKKIIKESAEPATKTAKTTTKVKEVEKRFQKSGSIDDAAATILARMGLSAND